MSDAKVIPIRQEKSKQQKPSKGDVIIEASAVLHPEQVFNGINLRSRGFDVRLMELENGVRLWAKVSEDQVVTLLDDEAVANKAASVLFLFFPMDYNLNSRDIKELLAVAKQLAEKRDNESTEKSIIKESEITPVLFKGQSGWCWHKLPYDPDTTNAVAKEYWETEVFPRFKKNFSAFMAWCGSLFDPRSPRVLCPWLYDEEGDTGKGTIANYIVECMGEAGGVLDPDMFSFDKFGLESTVGKRVIFIDECPAKLPTSEKFKRFTGENVQLVNRKGIKAVKMRIDAKALIASNHFPTIKGGKAFARRIMPVPFQEIKAPVRNKEDVKELMHMHGSYFWGVAMEEYRKDRELKNYDKSEILKYQEDRNEIIDLWIVKNINIKKNTLGSYFFPVRYAMEGVGRSRLDWKLVRERLENFHNVKFEPRYFKGVSAMCVINAEWIGGETGANFYENEPEIDF